MIPGDLYSKQMPEKHVRATSESLMSVVFIKEGHNCNDLP